MRRDILRAVLVAASIGVVAAGCVPPKDRRPGFRLSGEVVREPIRDWSFSDSASEIFVETRTWYLLPHSVTTVCAAHGGTLYVPSVYFDGGSFPQSRFWNRNVARDPRVRLQIGDRIYEREARRVTDPSEFRSVFEAFARKYDFWRGLLSKPEEERPDLVFLRMDPRSAS